jgi:hypothetical protein
MSDNLCAEINKLKIFAKNIQQLSSFTINNNSMLNYVEIINVIESIKYKFKNIFLESYNDVISKIENDPQYVVSNQYCNVETIDKDDDANIEEEYVNTYPNIAEQMENDNDVIMNRRLSAHKLKSDVEDSEKLPIYNALYKYSDADQDKILRNIFENAKFNVEKIMGIDASNPIFNESLNKEADELLRIWFSIRE